VLAITRKDRSRQIPQPEIRCDVERPRGAVATAAAVDYASAGQPKYERMASSGSLTGSRPPPAGDFALVFNKPLACSDGLQREKPLAMHR
jgi:hypothetical protein